MRLLLFILIFISFRSFAQNGFENQLTISQIDSIADSDPDTFGFLSLMPDKDNSCIGGRTEKTYYKHPLTGDTTLIRRMLELHCFEDRLFGRFMLKTTFIFYLNNDALYYGIIKQVKENRRGKILQEKEYYFTLNDGLIPDNLPLDIKESAESIYNFLNELDP